MDELPVSDRIVVLLNRGVLLMEVAVLDRHRPRRKFRRIVGPLLADLLNADSPTSHAPEADDGIPGHHDILSGEPPAPAAE